MHPPPFHTGLNLSVVQPPLSQEQIAVSVLRKSHVAHPHEMVQHKLVKFVLHPPNLGLLDLLHRFVLGRDLVGGGSQVRVFSEILPAALEEPAEKRIWLSYFFLFIVGPTLLYLYERGRNLLFIFDALRLCLYLNF